MFQTIAILAIAGFAIFLVWYYYETRIKTKEEGRLVNVIYFEYVGNEKRYVGNYIGSEIDDPKLGAYIHIDKLNKGFSQVTPEDYFPDSKYTKCVMVCKYADDDLRIISRLKNEGWYKKVKRPDLDIYETEVVKDNETGDEIIEFILDEEGEKILKTDKYGAPVSRYDFQKYTEPVGVTQQAREAIRFNRDFVRRMQEKRKQTEGFWSSYGQMILSAGIVFICLMLMAYNTNKVNQTQKYISDTILNEAKEIKKAQEEPQWVESLINKIQRKEAEQNAPDR